MDYQGFLIITTIMCVFFPCLILIVLGFICIFFIALFNLLRFIFFYIPYSLFDNDSYKAYRNKIKERKDELQRAHKRQLKRDLDSGIICYEWR